MVVIEGIAKIIIGDKAIELGRTKIKIGGMMPPKESPECVCQAEDDGEHLPICPLCISATIEITEEEDR